MLIQFQDLNGCLQSLWTSIDKDVQKENEEYFSIILDKTHETRLCKIFSATDSSIQKKHKDLLTDIFEQRKARKTSEYRIVELLKGLDEELQSENQKYIVDIFEEWLAEGKEAYIFNLWQNTSQNLKEKYSSLLFPQIMEYYEKTYDKDEGRYGKYYKLWDSASDTMREAYIKSFDSKQGYEAYKKMRSYNSELDSTIYPPILKDEILELFSFEDLIKITNDNKVQIQIDECISNPIYKEVLQYIYENNVNWILEFHEILNNKEEYEPLISKLELGDFQGSDIANLIHIVSQKQNYFDISNLEQVRNFYDIRKEICKNILEGKTENLPQSILDLEEGDRKKFALLEGIYGIDLKEAINLTKKYGKDIDKIEVKPENEAVISTILGMKRIVESDTIDEHIKENIELMSNYEKLVTEDFEAECIHIYERLYNDALYKLKDEDEIATEEYEGKEVKIYEINPNSEFNLMVRVEGAYTAYEEPESFKESLYSASTAYHGNCKSYISQDSIAIARPNGPILGYTECEENSLLLSAPWDIVSRKANTQFSTASTKWNYVNGIEFRTPEEQIDNTRHNHNEIVSERLIWDSENERFKKDKPQCIVYVVEPAKEDEPQDRWERINADDRWRMSKKAATQLEIPIVLIDREKFAEKEYQKVIELQQILLGERENKQNIPEEVLLERLITKFENNATGNRFTELNKYFSVERKEELIKSIFDKMEEQEYDDYDKYCEFLGSMIQVFQNEHNKTISSTGQKIYEDEEYYKKIVEKLEIRQKESQSNKIETTVTDQDKMKAMMKVIANTHFYDGNKQHSIEHIQKVMLFSEILAQNEGLGQEDREMLLIAAAFHDSGREGGIDGNTSHAVASSQKIEEYFEQNPNNEFGITQENLAIIQTAIHYHEHPEKEKGKLDLEEIKDLCEKYGADQKDFERIVKICELLKDADALDRARFAKHGRLDRAYLKSETAKNPRMISYAKKINRDVAITTLRDSYGKEPKDYYTKDPVLELRNTRRHEPRQEQHVDLINIYQKYQVDQSDVQKAYDRIKEDLEKNREVQEERE